MAKGKKAEGTMTLGTNYEMCKQAFKSGLQSPMTQTAVVQEISNIGAWCATEREFKYFMLLCREAYDFTMFNVQSTNYNKVNQEIQEVLATRGDIVFVEYDHETECYEIWVKCNEWMKTRTHEDYVVFRFFPCNDWVIEV